MTWIGRTHAPTLLTTETKTMTQDRVVHAEVRHTEIKEEGLTTYCLDIVDTETGDVLSPFQIRDLFHQDRITGVHVKPRHGTRMSDFTNLNLPTFAQITDLEEHYVVLDGEHRVPKSTFHKLYRLD